MTPLPKRKLSSARQGGRRASFKVKITRPSKCAKCGRLKASHARCRHCGQN